MAYTVQTQTPQFVDLGLLTINKSEEGSGLSTPATRTRNPVDSSHGSATDHIFEKVTAVRDKVRAKSEYSYKNLFWNLEEKSGL